MNYVFNVKDNLDTYIAELQAIGFERTEEIKMRRINNETLNFNCGMFP